MLTLRPIATLGVVSIYFVLSGSLAASGGTKTSTLPAYSQVVEMKTTKNQSEKPQLLYLAQSTSTVSGTDDSYRELTGNVINAIRNLNRATDPENTDSSNSGENAADRLRNAISELTRNVGEDGKSSNFVAKLIDEAVDSSGVNIPAALRGSDGKLDTNLLIKSVVSRSLAPAATGANTDYLAALNEEADSTVSTEVEVGANPINKPKFTIVSSGQTLGGIAWKYYGDSLAYLKIFEANKDKLKNPDRIQAGMKLILP